MASNSLPKKKFFLIAAAAVLGIGATASFIVPSANASKRASATVVTAPATVDSSPVTVVEPTNAIPEVAGIDCNNGIDPTGAQCDGGPAANINDNSVEPQSGSESQSETTSQ